MDIQILGLAKGTVTIRKYSTAWPRLFAVERQAIADAAGDGALAIEHVGSTSVPALAAKPILDIAVAVDSFEGAAALVAPIVALGYEYRGELGIARRHYFTKGAPRTHHIHMLEAGSVEWRRMIAFRDRLRAEPAIAAEYERLKRELATRFAGERERYTEAKSVFILSVVGDVGE